MGLQRLGVLLVVALTATVLHADGIPFKGDRVDGKKTVLLLSLQQEKILKAKNPRAPEGKITLTANQRALLLKEAGYAPQTLDIWSLSTARTECTCGALNVGVRYARGLVDVPHCLLGRGEQVAPPPARVAPSEPAKPTAVQSVQVPASAASRWPVYLLVAALLVMFVSLAIMLPRRGWAGSAGRQWR